MDQHLSCKEDVVSSILTDGSTSNEGINYYENKNIIDDFLKIICDIWR